MVVRRASGHLPRGGGAAQAARTGAAPDAPRRRRRAPTRETCRQLSKEEGSELGYQEDPGLRAGKRARGREPGGARPRRTSEDRREEPLVEHRRSLRGPRASPRRRRGPPWGADRRRARAQENRAEARRQEVRRRRRRRRRTRVRSQRSLDLDAHLGRRRRARAHPGGAAPRGAFHGCHRRPGRTDAAPAAGSGRASGRGRGTRAGRSAGTGTRSRAGTRSRIGAGACSGTRAGGRRSPGGSGCRRACCPRSPRRCTGTRSSSSSSSSSSRGPGCRGARRSGGCR